MKLLEILSPSFRTFQGSSKAKVDWLLPFQQMVRKCQAMHLFHRHFTVESLLEDHATPDQKARHIDLLDFCLESAAPST